MPNDNVLAVFGFDGGGGDGGGLMTEAVTVAPVAVSADPAVPAADWRVVVKAEPVTEVEAAA